MIFPCQEMVNRSALALRLIVVASSINNPHHNQRFNMRECNPDIQPDIIDRDGHCREDMDIVQLDASVRVMLLCYFNFVDDSPVNRHHDYVHD